MQLTLSLSGLSPLVRTGLWVGVLFGVVDLVVTQVRLPFAPYLPGIAAVLLGSAFALFAGEAFAMAKERGLLPAIRTGALAGLLAAVVFKSIVMTAATVIQHGLGALRPFVNVNYGRFLLGELAAGTALGALAAAVGGIAWKLRSRT